MTTIRDLISWAQSHGCPAMVYPTGLMFKAWPNGHVRVGGVHHTIKQAQEKLEWAQSAESAIKAGLS